MKAQFIYLLLFTCVFTNMYAQEFPYQDTIKINVDNRLSATIAFSDYREFIKRKNILGDLNTLKSDIIKAKAEIPVYQNYKIEFYPGKSLVIEEGENKKTFRLVGDVLINLNYIYDCNVHGKGYNMHIVFSDLNDITSANMNVMIEEWLQSLQKERIPRNVVGKSISKKSPSKDSIIKDSSVVKLDLLLATRKRSEFISGGGIGVGMVKNQPLNSLSVFIGVRFRKKGIIHNDLYTTLRVFPTFDNNILRKNSFQYFGWRSNISGDNKKQNWIGLEYGYNIKNESDFFGSNTKVIGLLRQYGRITIVPELYFTGFFKNPYPGLRVEFGL